MRRSISRMFSRYWFIVCRSDGPSLTCSDDASFVIASRIERSSWIRASRSAADPPCPNIRSNTLRGLISIGIGVVGVRHDSVFM
jgi:hypothetical protein